MDHTATTLAWAANDVARIARIEQISRILDICGRITGMGFCAVVRVTEREWLTCAALDKVGFGLKPGDFLPLESTICDEIRQSREMVVFDDSDSDDRFRDHHTPRIYGLKSYISVPIILPDGEFFGTLCAIDSQPKRVNCPEIVGTFQLFADLIARELAAQKTTEVLQHALNLERETARMREEFIAIVGHDLRTPITAFASGLRLLERETGDEEFIKQEMRNSIARMTALVANLMDFARGRLGGGIVADRQDDVAPQAIIDAIVGEVRSTTDREIRVASDLAGTISCDPMRIGQLLANLLGNAVTHGTPGTPITVQATLADETLRISVANPGPTIAPEILAGLFQPFRRGGTLSKGLGLGLYISAEIARAHGGALTATSANSEIRFTFEMPCAAAV